MTPGTAAAAQPDNKQPGRQPRALAPVNAAALMSRREQAIMSLENTRRALRAQLMPEAPAAAGGQAGAASARRWLRRLRRWPAGQRMGEAVQQWWHRQPWQPLASQAVNEARLHVWPLVQRHPWWVVGAAAAVGATLTAVRPWRWVWVDHHVRRAPGAASRWLLKELSAAPVQALILGLATLLLRRASGPSAPAPAPSPAPVPPPDREREPDGQPGPPIGDPGRAAPPAVPA